MSNDPGLKFVEGDYVRKTDGGVQFEGEIVTSYRSRKGRPMAVVEIVGGPFAGMQHIYREDQLGLAKPSRWFDLFAGSDG